MATHNKQTEGKETVEFFQDLDKDALKTEKFVEKNAKIIIVFFVVALLGILGYFGYEQFIIKPKNEEALKSFLAAEKKLNQGQEEDALGGKSPVNLGFVGTYKEFSNTAVGKLSAYNAGLLKFKQGKYKEAYDLLDGFSSENDILMALKYGAMADCQANQNKANEALELLDKASTISKDAYTSYYFTKKAGMLALALNKKVDAKKYFSLVDEKYRDYDNGMSDSYIEMVKYF